MGTPILFACIEAIEASEALFRHVDGHKNLALTREKENDEGRFKMLNYCPPMPCNQSI
jgi:hypothetical protein